MNSDEQREFVERLHVLPPRAGDESQLAPPEISSNTGPRSFPVSPSLSHSPPEMKYETSQDPSQQDLSWPQTLEDQSEWAFAPQALMEQSNQLVDRPPFGLIGPADSMNTYPYSNGHHHSGLPNATFFHGYPSPISPLYDSEDRSLHYSAGVQAPPHHIASTQRFERPGNQNYGQYNPTMAQYMAQHYQYSADEEFDMEMSRRPLVEQQHHLDSDQTSQPEDTPYAQLIYQALMSVEDHRMILRDIYKWIAENTDKAADPDFTGWQNSVRHNLSMNQAFNKLPYTNPLDKSKKGFIWALEESAIANGIQPTTRYRKKDDYKAASSSKPKGRVQDILRQRSGRRGGQAAGRRTTREMLQRRDREAQQHHHRRHHKHHHRQQQQQQQHHSSASSSTTAASPYGSSSPSLPFFPPTTTTTPVFTSSPSTPLIANNRARSRLYEPAPLSAFDETERAELLPYTNTSGLPDLWIRPCPGLVAPDLRSHSATPTSSCFRTSDEDEGGSSPYVYTGVAAPELPFLRSRPEQYVGDVNADGDAAGYLADVEASSEVFDGLPAGEEEVGGWGAGEGMGYQGHEGVEFEQAFGMDGEDGGRFLEGSD